MYNKLNDLQFPQKKEKRKVEWLTINICLFFSPSFYFKEKKKEFEEVWYGLVGEIVRLWQDMS